MTQPMQPAEYVGMTYCVPQSSAESVSSSLSCSFVMFLRSWLLRLWIALQSSQGVGCRVEVNLNVLLAAYFESICDVLGMMVYWGCHVDVLVMMICVFIHMLTLWVIILLCYSYVDVDDDDLLSMLIPTWIIRACHVLRIFIALSQR